MRSLTTGAAGVAAMAKPIVNVRSESATVVVRRRRNGFFALGIDSSVARGVFCEAVFPISYESQPTRTVHAR